MPSRDETEERASEEGAVCRLAPLNPNVLLNEGNSLCEQEQFEEAVAVYDAALALSPAAAPLRAMLLSNRGMARLEQHQAEAALTDFDAALSVLSSLQEEPDDERLLQDIRHSVLGGKARALGGIPDGRAGQQPMRTSFPHITGDPTWGRFLDRDGYTAFLRDQGVKDEIVARLTIRFATQDRKWGLIRSHIGCFESRSMRISLFTAWLAEEYHHRSWWQRRLAWLLEAPPVAPTTLWVEEQQDALAQLQEVLLHETGHLLQEVLWKDRTEARWRWGMCLVAIAAILASNAGIAALATWLLGLLHQPLLVMIPIAVIATILCEVIIIRSCAHLASLFAPDERSADRFAEDFSDKVVLFRLEQPPDTRKEEHV